MFDEIRRNLSEAQKSADKLQMLVGRSFQSNHERRILDLEKQVAELRALLVEKR
jgi:hypothetical protein